MGVARRWRVRMLVCVALVAVCHGLNLPIAGRLRRRGPQARRRTRTCRPDDRRCRCLVLRRLPRLPPPMRAPRRCCRRRHRRRAPAPAAPCGSSRRACRFTSRPAARRRSICSARCMSAIPPTTRPRDRSARRFSRRWPHRRRSRSNCRRTICWSRRTTWRSTACVRMRVCRVYCRSLCAQAGDASARQSARAR